VNIVAEQSESRPTPAVTRVIVLIIGDALVMLLFAWVGRRSHAMSMFDIGALLTAAVPFIVAWFLVTPWFGLFTTEVSQHWRRLLPRLLIGWAIGGPLALVLRALFLGRPIPAGIIPSFAVVALGFTTLLMLAWRLGYCWWANRRRPQTDEAGEATL
jgi:hypothetical protein